jgi:protein-tyrosine phosphatase
VRLYQIVPQLYQRGAFAHLNDKVPALRAAGIEVVVSLWRPDPDLFDVVEYHHYPTSDGQKIDRGLYGALAYDFARCVRDGRTVLVHCQGGRNRSGLLNALIVRQLYGCTGLDAANVVRLARPGALANPYFLRYLVGLPVPDRRVPDPGTSGKGMQDVSEDERTPSEAA